MAAIYANRIELDQDVVQDLSGILNSLSYASAQYVYRVIERHVKKQDVKWLDNEKLKKLRRSIVHTDAHQDEYFAELFFRAILPPGLRDLEIREHNIISKENDTFAKIY